VGRKSFQGCRLLVLACVFSVAGTAGPEVWRQTTRAEFESCELRNIDTTTSPGSVSLSGAYSPDESTVLLLHFDEGEGDPSDSSPAGNKMTNHGAAWAGEGKFGGALSFDGADDYVFAPAEGGSPLELGGAFTVEGWVKIPSLPDKQSHAILGTHGYKHGYRLSLSSQPGCRGKLVFQIGRERGGRSHYSCERVLPGDWRHFAVTYNAAAPSGNLKFYLDGILDRTLDFAEPLLPSGHFYIGSSGGLGHFRGLLDEIRISNRERRPDEFSCSPSSCYFVSGHIVSPTINQQATDVASAALEWQARMPPKADVEFFVTNNGGTRWHKVARQSARFDFPSPGADLRVKAVLRRGHGAPALSSWTVSYWRRGE